MEYKNSSLEAYIYRDRREGYSKERKFEISACRLMSRSSAGKGKDLCGRRHREAPKLRAPGDQSLRIQGRACKMGAKWQVNQTSRALEAMLLRCTQVFRRRSQGVLHASWLFPGIFRPVCLCFSRGSCQL